MNVNVCHTFLSILNVTPMAYGYATQWVDMMSVATSCGVLTFLGLNASNPKIAGAVIDAHFLLPLPNELLVAALLRSVTRQPYSADLWLIRCHPWTGSLLFSYCRRQ